MGIPLSYQQDLTKWWSNVMKKTNRFGTGHDKMTDVVVVGEIILAVGALGIYTIVLPSFIPAFTMVKKEKKLDSFWLFSILLVDSFGFFSFFWWILFSPFFFSLKFRYFSLSFHVLFGHVFLWSVFISCVGCFLLHFFFGYLPPRFLPFLMFFFTLRRCSRYGYSYFLLPLSLLLLVLHVFVVVFHSVSFSFWLFPTPFLAPFNVFFYFGGVFTFYLMRYFHNRRLPSQWKMFRVSLCVLFCTGDARGRDGGQTHPERDSGEAEEGFPPPYSPAHSSTGVYVCFFHIIYSLSINQIPLITE